MINHRTEHDWGTCYWHEHSPEELEAGWNAIDEQGNRQARGRGWACIVVPCDKAEALNLSAMFHRHFACESCCHWDGETLSMYCGDAGSNYLQVMDNVRQDVARMGFVEIIGKRKE